jgi:site-specific recombinase XerD
VAHQPPAPATEDVIAEFLADLARQGRPASTIRAYRSDLADFTRFHPGPLTSVTPAVLRAYLATLAGKAPATRARREAALSSLLAWAYRAELIDADPMTRLDRTGIPASLPRPMPAGHVDAVLQAIARHKGPRPAAVHPALHHRHLLRGSDRDKWDVLTDHPGRAVIDYSPPPCEVLHMWRVRDSQASEQQRQRAPHPRGRAAKGVCRASGATSCDRLGTRGEGLRIGEALAIDVDDLDLTRDDEHVTALGKGGRRRTVLLDDPGLVSLLRRYLRARGYRHGPLFRAEKNHADGPLRYASAQELWAKYCAKAQVNATIHQLRHAHATELVNAGVSLETIRRRPGHANAQTVLRYADQHDTTTDAQIRA